MAAAVSSLLSGCEACPRLVALRASVRAAHPDYHAAPVAAWGGRDARLLIVGLAPGMHGANRTGRPFTGDASGHFLFRALHRAGFASSPRADEARLANVRITNAVKCLPPENRPTAAEIRRCADYLRQELAELRGVRPRRPRVIACLGRLAHQAVAMATVETVPAFRHGRVTEIAPRVYLADTYHPSRQNTNTGRLSEEMLDQVFFRIRQLLRSG